MLLRTIAAGVYISAAMLMGVVAELQLVDAETGVLGVWLMAAIATYNLVRGIAENPLVQNAYGWGKRVISNE